MAESSTHHGKAKQNFRVVMRWAFAVLTLVSLVVLAANVTAQYSLTGRPAVDLLILGGVANLCFYVFVRTSFWSNSKQVGLIATIVSLQVAGYFSVKLDGLYGNGYPKLAWKWTTAPADRDFNDKVTDIPIDVEPNSRWPGFRGKNCSGIVDDLQLVDWDVAPPRLVWERPIGGGWSSFAITGNICVTHEQRGNDEAVVCYELATGNLVWEHRDQARFQEVSGGEGPRATPAVADDLVYSFGATGILNCLQLSSGQVVWSRNVLDENDIQNRLFGMAGSPLVAEDYVIVAPGGQNTTLIAYNRFDGSQVWTSGDETASYASPQLEMVCGIKAILNFSGDGLSGFQLSDGRRLFHIPWVSNPSEKNNVCQPIVLKSSEEVTSIFLSSGYGKGCAVFHISKTQEGFAVDNIWANKNLKSKFASAVLDGSVVFGLDNGILTCVDESGQQMWKSGRYGHGQLIRVGNSLLIQSERGYVARVECSPTQQMETGRIEALGTRTWNHPAFNGKYLLVRNDRKAMCFELTVANASQDN